MNTTGLFNLSWQRYLNLLFLLLTVGFLTSGVVTLIAANLDYFSDLAKIYWLTNTACGDTGIRPLLFYSRKSSTSQRKIKVEDI